MAHLVTKDSLQAMLDNADPELRIRIVGRALVVLFERQTEYEKSANTTNNENGVGFTGADGRTGVLTAKTFLKSRTLKDWQVDRWMVRGKSGYSRIVKYWRQLDQAAKKKAGVNG